MARWHGAYCRVPDVAVDAGVPSCQSCGECWDLESFVAQQRNANPFPQIPPNENPGDLDLFWPPTVPYAREIEIHCLPQEEESSCSNTSLSEATGTHAIHAPSTAPEPPRIYNRELGPEDFRLLCLQGSADSSSPIRADLENYAFERCPEYEAVSYAWGGEDNDVSPCQPLFLGPYWDPLPLTNNCWSMLQALRPTRGMRMLWVDAICINQDNAEERAEQVARMAFIYRDCRRVISYLGPDLVASPSISSGFPRRQRLEDSVTMADDELFIGGKVNFLKLIQRRYFTRVWIIQELVLPRQVSIPVGDIELCADQQTARNLPELFWESVGVPWIGFLAQGGVEGAEIFDILLITADSHSTDPRDRVFGVLALLPTSRGGHQGPLRPNYSISPLHVSIGISAHCLLALKRTEMLFAAAGLNGYPTWAPDWKVRNQGLALRSEMAAEEKEERVKKGGNIGQGRRERMFFHWHDNQTYNIRILNLSQVRPEYNRNIVAATQPSERVESTSINWSSTVRKRPPSAQWKSSAFGNRRTRLALTTAWDHEACVDGKTGALSINLVHILQFPTAPELVGTGGEGGQVFSVQPRSVPFCGVADREKAVHLWLTSTGPLHETVDPKTDHLFLLDEGDKAPLYLVLREDQDGTTDENTFKLIGCCEYLCFGTGHGVDLTIRLSVTDIYEADTDLRYTTELNRGPGLLFPRDLNSWSHAKIIKLARGFAPAISGKEQHILQQLFGKMDSILPNSQIMAVFQGLLDDFRDGAPSIGLSRFLKAYIASLREKFQARVATDDHIVLTVQSKNWEAFIPSNPPLLEIYKEWRDDPTSDWHPLSTAPKTAPEGGMPLYIRASQHDLEEIAWHSHLCGALLRLSSVAYRTGESELELLQRELRPEDYLTAYPQWPEELVRGFGIDGSLYRVRIL